MEQGVKPGIDPRRVIIQSVTPEIEGGRFAVKRVVGELVVVRADIFADGHDLVRADLQFRRETERGWSSVRMTDAINDCWRGEFRLLDTCHHYFRIEAWIDRFGSWRRDLEKKAAAGQDLDVEFLIGAGQIEAAATRADDEARAALLIEAAKLREAGAARETRLAHALSERLLALMNAHPDRRNATIYDSGQRVEVDPPLARFSAWYEMFPRSASGDARRHGTFRDCEAWLPYVASMGFDVLYFPPIHPIGRRFRKGANNALTPEPEAPGSPWAIGGPEGGHKSVHPELGTLEDFRRLVTRAREMGIEVALDIALQCSPDHPYVRERPDWFVARPDGTIQYAENPPKKYQDIYPFNFECDAAEELWNEVKSIFRFWIEQGVRVFRVDNPHTKPIRLWDWLIAEIRRNRPDVVFLAEAFTRPKIMARLARGGFTQSYTYFAWRRSKAEIIDYMRELTRTELSEYFRPNFWPNTPDILTDQLRGGSPAMFRARLILAAMLSSNYGIYGPAFELMEGRALRAGSEEYLDSEKYQLRAWDLHARDSLRDFIALVNHIRRENPALHANTHLEFHGINNDHILVFSKRTEDFSNVILIAVNLDAGARQLGWTDLWMEELGVGRDEPYQAHDLLTDVVYAWKGPHAYVELNPEKAVAHVFRIERIARTERDFEMF